MLQRLAVLLLVLGWGDFIWAAPKIHITGLVRQRDAVWAGTFGHGLLRSTDGGQSWAKAVLSPEVTRVLSLASTRGGAIVVGTEGTGVWRSDGGDHAWARWDRGLPDGTSVEAILADETNVAWAGTTDDGLFRRDPKDAAWRRVGMWKSFAGVSMIAESYDVLFVGTAGDGLFRSEDHGETWGRCVGIPEGLVVAAWSQTEAGHIVVGGEDGTLFLGDESGRSWIILSAGALGSSLYELVALPDGRIVAATSHGVYVTGLEGNGWKLQPVPRQNRKADASVRLFGRESTRPTALERHGFRENSRRRDRLEVVGSPKPSGRTDVDRDVSGLT